MNKSKYFVAQDLYKSKARAEDVRNTIYKYLEERVDGQPVGIDAREIFLLAKVSLKSKELTEAEKLLKICINLDSKNVHARLELGKLYAKQGKEEETEKLFKECIKLEPKDVHSRLELGKLYVKQGKEEEAERLFKERMELDPKNVYARLELGKLYAKQGKEQESEELFKEIMKLDPKNVHARLELGKLYVKQGKEQESEKLFKEYMELDPKNVYARLELGKLYAKQGKEQESEELFKEIMKLDPKNVHARLELGKLYVKQGKEQESEELFKEIMKLDPKDVYARLELGKLYVKQGKEQESEELFKEIMKLDPKDIHARLELGKLYAKQRKEQKAKYKPREGYEDIEKYFLSLEEKENSEERLESPYILRKDGLVDALSCLVAQYFESLPEEEKKSIKERFMYLQNKKPEQVTMETNNLIWYLRFRYKNVSVLERFFKIKENGEYVAFQSRTLVVPNDVQISPDGKITPEQRKLIEVQNHTSDYIRSLEEKIKKVELGYIRRVNQLER